MNIQVAASRRTQALRGLASFALSWALSFSVLAVNLNNEASTVEGVSVAVDTASYRSSAGRHKVMIQRGNAERAKNIQAIRNHNYGSFQVLEVDKATADRLIASGIASNADGQNLILLNTGALDTTSPDVVANSAKALSMSSGKQLHLVHFPGPIKPEWYAQLEATGVEIVNPMPSNAYLVYGDAVALDKVAALTDNGLAQWQGPYLSTYKLQPGVSTDAKTLAANATKSLAQGAQGDSKANLYQVQLIRDPTTNAATEALFSLVPAVSRYEIKSYVNLVVTIAPELLGQVAKRPDVISVAKYIEPRRMDERQAMILAGDLTGNTPNPGNYFSKLSGWGLTQSQFNTSGFVVDVTDDGVDRNPTAGIGQDANTGPVPARHFVLYEGGSLANASRFMYKGRWGSAATADGGLGLSGHGQLNMSIIGGYVPDSLDPGNTTQAHRDAQGFRYGLGIAPFVKLGNSVIFDPGFTSPSYPNLLSNAYASNARISSNSWGAATSGAYNTDAQAYDILVRDSQSGTAGNQQMLAVFAAGNNGAAAGTVGSPGTGKNVLTVGAGENVRSHNAAAGGAGVGADGCGINDTGADSANDIISFSSRGPTADGRKKPDIVAPGTHVTGMSFVAVGQDPTLTTLGAADAAYRADVVCSMGSGGAGNVSNFFPLTPAQKWYTTSSGTSHSTPAVAGSAALIYQQFLNNPSYISANRTPAGANPPSPALVKAYLTNSARYMTGVSANDTLPSNNQGMGSVNLGTAFDGVQRIIRDQDATDRFTATGQIRSYFATVTSATAPLRVTLAYTDKEGSTTSGAIVNNLDLTVTAGGNTYKGNVFSGANSAIGGTADTRNNLESVFIPAGLPVGTPVLVQVTATNIAGIADPTVAGPNQDFALVIYNAAPAAPQAALSFASVTLPTGNGRIDANDCNDLNISLANSGGLAATGVSASLSTSTPELTITQANSAYPDIGAGASQSNSTPFKVSTTAAAVNGSTANFTLTTTFTGGTSPTVSNFSLPIGVSTTDYLFTASTGATIPAGGTLVAGSATDDLVFSVTTPFAFSVYGTAVASGQTISLSTNGNIQFVATGGSTSLANTVLPSTILPNAVSVLPYWDDLLLTTPGGGIYTNTVGTAPNRQFIIEWRGRRFNDGSSTQNINFAAVFNEGSNQFELRYVQTGIGNALNGVSATVGVQAGNTPTSNFTQYSFNQGVITPGLILSAAFPAATPGSGACSAATLPVITLNPAMPPSTPGATVTYTAAATGSPTPTVQWQSSSDGSRFTDIPGATSTTLVIQTATTRNIYQYRAVFTNGAGSVATTATPPPRRF